MVFRGTRSQVLDDKNAVLKNCPKFTGNMKAVGFSAVIIYLFKVNNRNTKKDAEFAHS